MNLKNIILVFILHCAILSKAQIRLAIEEPNISLENEHYSFYKKLHSHIVKNLVNSGSFLLVEREFFDELTYLRQHMTNSNVLSSGLVGADYLLNYKIKNLSIKTKSETNEERKPNGPMRYTILNIHMAMEIEVTDIKSGQLLTTKTSNYSVEEKVGGHTVEEQNEFSFASHNAISRLSNSIDQTISTQIFSSIGVEFDVIGEAYRRGKRLSGVLISLSKSSLFRQEANFEIYKRTYIDINGESIAKNEFICNGSLFESFDNYSTLLVRKGSKDLDKALKQGDKLIAKYKID